MSQLRLTLHNLESDEYRKTDLLRREVILSVCQMKK
jgi:hypothetical protein